MREMETDTSLDLVVIIGAFLLTASVIAWWSFNSYFGGNYEELLIYRGNDGHCDTATNGFGVHCWGDYFTLRFDSLFSDPHPAEAIYPLGSRLVRIPFWIFGKLIGYPFEIASFLIVSATSCLVPLFLATRGKSLIYRTLVITVFGTCGVGFLATLDRGNQVGLAVLPLFMICRQLIREVPSTGTVSVWFSFVGVIKPQFLVLLLFLFVFRKLSLLVIPAASSIATFVVTQIFLGRGIASISHMLKSQRNWSLAGTEEMDYPTNYSVYRLLVQLGIDIPALGFAVPLLLMSMIIVSRIAKNQRLFPADLQFGVLCMVIFGTIVYVYYAVLAIIVIALAHYKNTGVEDDTPAVRVRHLMLIFCAVVLNAPLVIANSWLGLSSLAARNVWPLVTTSLIFLATLGYGLDAVLDAIQKRGTRRGSQVA